MLPLLMHAYDDIWRWHYRVIADCLQGAWRFLQSSSYFTTAIYLPGIDQPQARTKTPLTTQERAQQTLTAAGWLDNKDDLKPGLPPLL